jgi:protein-arginine kinase activator protein McsA
MRRAPKIALWTLFTASGLFIVGCQANRTQAAAEPASTQALMCDKCKVTYVQVPVTGGKTRVVGYQSEKRMECPDCKTAAENFFTTGKFQHACKTCGDSIEVCKAH